MTAFDYTTSRATADRLIARFGQSATLTRNAASGDAFDPTQTPTEYPCTIVLLDYNNRDIDGTLILQSDKRVLMSAVGLAVTPAVGDKIGNLSVVAVNTLTPGGTVVLYELQARV